MQYDTEGNIFVGNNGELFVLKPYQTLKNKSYALKQVLGAPAVYPEIDISATKALSLEIPPRRVNLDRDNYLNELNKPLPDIQIGADKVLFNSFPHISDEFISEFAQKAGLQFRRQDVYNHAEFDENTKKIKYTDLKGKPVDIDAQGLSYDNCIWITNEIISLNKNDYLAAQKNEQAIRDLEKANPLLTYWEAKDQVLAKRSLKEQKLYNVYERALMKEHEVKRTILHEIKHFKNNFLIESRQYKEGYKNLSVKNLFNRCIDDERSASFEELIYSINTYLEQEKYEDYSMFGAPAQSLVQYLKRINAKKELTDEEKKQKIVKYFTNLPKLMSFEYIQWNDELPKYIEDFGGIVKEEAEQLPYLKETEQNNEEYFQQRSIIYSYRIYNPETKKYDYHDLSQQIYGQVETDEKLVNVCEHPEVLSEYINVDKVFQKDIAEINKLLKLKRVRESLNFKKFDKSLLARGKNLSQRWFQRSIARRKADYVTQKVYVQSGGLTL